MSARFTITSATSPTSTSLTTGATRPRLGASLPSVSTSFMSSASRGHALREGQHTVGPHVAVANSRPPRACCKDELLGVIGDEPMAEAPAPSESRISRQPDVKEVHVVWITAGLGCDGDSVSVTAATQPSIEDVLMGAIPGLPKVHLHNPVLAYEVGDDFMRYFYAAERGEIDPFVLVIEGSIPNEKIKREGYWAALGTDPDQANPSLPLSGSTAWLLK